MPSIDQLSNADVSGYSLVGQKASTPIPKIENLMVQRSTAQVSSLPYLPGTFPSTDSVAGFGLAGKLPQWRAPVPAVNSSATGSTTNTTIVSSSSSTTTNNPPKSQTASAAIPSLNPGQQYTGTILLAKSFYTIFISTDSSIRLRLYGSASAQSGDLIRPATTPPGYGNEQGIIADWNLPNAPVVWISTPSALGSNLDSPQTNVIYLTVDNIGVASESPNISITYVPIQS